MPQISFHTTLKCAGCEATVKPFIEAVPGVESWKVDLTDPKRTLTVSGDDFDEAQVKSAIEKAGFKAEKVG